MSVILTASAEEALKLQRPLPDGVLEIVARSRKKDEAPLEVGGAASLHSIR
jgi:hypothetical protein